MDSWSIVDRAFNLVDFYWEIVAILEGEDGVPVLEYFDEYVNRCWLDHSAY